MSRVDVLSGVRTRIGPPGCRYIDIAADGDLLFTCVPNDARVLDAATGAWTTLPPHGRRWSSTNRSATTSSAVTGVQLLGRGEKGEAAIYVSRSTGQVRAARPDARHQVDLDDAALSRRLSRGFQRPRVGLDYGGTGYGDLMIAGRWAATTVYQDPDAGIDAPTRVLLERCGRTARTLTVARRGTTYSRPVIGRRFVAWISETHDRARVHVVSLDSGLRRAITIPKNATAPLLAADRLYVSAGGRLLSIKV